VTRVWLAIVSAWVVALGAAASAGAVTIKEFPIEPGAPATAHAPRYIHPGPDGNLWITDGGATGGGIDRMDTNGTPLAGIPDSHGPDDLVFQPDGTVFWSGDSGYGHMLPNGTVEKASGFAGYAVALTAGGDLRWSVLAGGSSGLCSLTATFASPSCLSSGAGGTRITGLTLDSGGRLWAAGPEANTVWRLKDTGSFIDTSVVTFPAGSTPARLALVPDGNLWVTLFGASEIARITPAGVVTPFALGPSRAPNDITLGPDGSLWFTELGGNAIGRMTLDGKLTNEFAIPTADSKPSGITVGPDGAIWFTESASGKIGRLQLDPPQGGGPGGVTDTVAPTFLRGASFSVTRFRVARASTPLSARSAPKGSTLTYSLSEPSSVSIAIARRASGRRVRRSCRAPSHSNRGKPHCTRYVLTGTLKRTGLQGVNAVAFSGRIGRHALRPGSYRVTVTATDAAGNASKGSAASFTIVR
jgi:streptogramin lyase